MYKYPPAIPTNYTPEELIGHHNMTTLVNHIKAFNGGRPQKFNQLMADIIDRLQKHGYYIDGIRADGSIRFAVMLKSQVQMAFEGPEFEEIKRMSMDEMRAKARGGYVGMRTDDEFGKLRN